MAEPLEHRSRLAPRPPSTTPPGGTSSSPHPPPSYENLSITPPPSLRNERRCYIPSSYRTLPRWTLSPWRPPLLPSPLYPRIHFSPPATRYTSPLSTPGTRTPSPSRSAAVRSSTPVPCVRTRGNIRPAAAPGSTPRYRRHSPGAFTASARPYVVRPPVQRWRRRASTAAVARDRHRVPSVAAGAECRPAQTRPRPRAPLRRLPPVRRRRSSLPLPTPVGRLRRRTPPPPPTIPSGSPSLTWSSPSMYRRSMRLSTSSARVAPTGRPDLAQALMTALKDTVLGITGGRGVRPPPPPSSRPHATMRGCRTARRAAPRRSPPRTPPS